ncbi:Ig-like domain-containing protein [Gemmata algarum]|uniref:Ig-like domain-containing protein n=1 Tax=Gemmata algarum TaxID=2975278 RepID=UPI002DD664C8|nr:DUF1573 domain-containing protein [Gemmata algarum]
MKLRPLPYSVVSRLLGAALCAAGLLKGHELAVEGGAPSGPEGVISVGSVFSETLFGVWLVLGLWPRVSWWLAAGCFVAFLGVALDKAVAGHTSCGCFGRVVVPPWYTVAFDAAAILLLALCAAGVSVGPSVAGRRWRVAALAVTGLGLSVGLAGAFRSAPRSFGGEQVLAEGETIRLSPDEWLGHSFPLAQYIDGGDRLTSGEWVVMFYHADCPKCQSALPLYVGLARQLADASSRTRVALVEMPPFTERETRPAGRDAAFFQARLSARHRWVLNPPLFLLLKDGIVTKATNSPAVLLQEVGTVIALSDEAIDSPRLFPDYRRIRREAFLKEIACGPLALIAVFDALGVPVTPAEADQLIGEAGNEGIDLLRLKQLAEARGLHTLGVEVSPDKLKRMGHKAIVRLNKVGFAAVTGFVPDGVLVSQPLRAPGAVPESVFERMFGQEGVALLVSRTPLDRSELGLGPDETAGGGKQGPRIRLSRSLVTAGRIHLSNWQAELTITNDGTAPLVINEIEADCRCFSAAADAKEIPPGGSTKLRVRGTETRLGSFTYSLTLRTNQLPTGTVTVPVRGYLEQPVGFETPALQLRDRLPNRPVACEVGLDIPPTLRPEQLRVEVPAGAPLTADVRPTAAGRHALVVRSAGVPTVGWHRWQIKVFADKAEQKLASSFHLAVEVMPEIDLSVPSAHVPDSELDREWSRKVVAKVHTGVAAAGGWNVAWRDPKLHDVLAIQQAGGGDTLSITLKPTGAAPRHRGRAELVVETAGVQRVFHLYLGDAAFGAEGTRE